MKTLVKTHWAKLCILALLLVLMGALPSVHAACSSKVDAAVAQLQESARAENSVDDWLAQIVDKTKDFVNLSDSQLVGKAPNYYHEAKRKNLQTTLFPNKQALVYFRKYLADVKIRQSSDGYSAPRKFLFNGITYEFDYSYPSEGVRQGSIGSECQFEIRLNTSFFVEDFGDAGTTYLYGFDLVNGKMKLIKTNAAG
ncbi:MAG: hypothetical protein LBQ75_06065 [Zoogloeaceae bacterium]|jgi:hypothetical protein|nr:hypothetical protein [Zoogloeaceae bacterium]